MSLGLEMVVSIAARAARKALIADYLCMHQLTAA